MWLSLFKAVGNRDAGQMLVFSEQLLSSQATNMSFHQRAYLLMAGMTGALVLHDKEKAMAIWDRHGQDVVRRGGAPGLIFVFRLLVAHSASEHPVALGLATR